MLFCSEESAQRVKPVKKEWQGKPRLVMRKHGSVPSDGHCSGIQLLQPESVLFSTASVVTQLSLVTVCLELFDYRMLKNLRLTVYG